MADGIFPSDEMIARALRGVTLQYEARCPKVIEAISDNPEAQKQLSSFLDNEALVIAAQIARTHAQDVWLRNLEFCNEKFCNK